MISCRHLTKRYGSRIAVQDLSFDVQPGVVTAFLGPNGAGKSTTLRLMLELDHGEGVTTFDGTRFSQMSDPVHTVGAVLETRAWHPGRTARNHLRMLAIGGGVAEQRVDEVLTTVGLADVADRRPGGFSLGMAQRLSLAAALLGDPGTIILDEPENGLDPQGIHWLRTLLRGLANEGRTVLVSSHQLAGVEALAQEVVVLGRGRVLAQGSLQQFVAEAGAERLEDAYLQVTEEAVEYVGGAEHV
ncbi:ATP-binding cassette domain-containing protein [Kineosporia rhizophila]|uniref:ABC transporter ATP-binding protein n=1 Tax=Kineosporia TaxID=49184 RepID=UPI001E4DBB4A|nr:MULTISPECIES: ATP-binding cassette domain-containing protein [Kineosporia]MCE0535840.1 ATP-binding cassette domain-containing protein [Kineosporia rhizophila]GLY18176.1 ABC transporter ATP-binding protein [Kineosporia sp. NBRC 101677]